MLGNDIVDLSDPQTLRGGQHPRFDRRVFTPAERAVLARSRNPQRTRWMLWAVKESAYKAVRRARPRTVFSPIRFSVDLEHDFDASPGVGSRLLVTHEGTDYFAHVETDGRYVHAIVSDAAHASGAVWGSKRIGEASPQRASREVRALALDQLSARLGSDRDEIRIETRERIPHLVDRNGGVAATLSLSHHGGFVGFACRLASASDSSAGGTP